jgi:hypothetical protein
VVSATREAASEGLISKRQKVWFLKLVLHKFAKHVHEHHGHHHKRSRRR